jgi:hypothetical protein
MLATENSGISFEPVVNHRRNNPEVIEIFNDDVDDNIYQDIVKVEDETGSETIDVEPIPEMLSTDMQEMNHPRRSARTQIANKLYHDHELHTTMDKNERS